MLPTQETPNLYQQKWDKTITYLMYQARASRRQLSWSAPRLNKIQGKYFSFCSTCYVKEKSSEIFSCSGLFSVLRVESYAFSGVVPIRPAYSNE